MEGSYPIVLHNLIVDIFNVFFKGVTVPPLHAFPQLKPYILLEVFASVRPTDQVPVRVGPVCLGPSPEILHDHVLFRS